MIPEFVDTNVFIYAEEAAGGAKREAALALLGRLVEDQCGAVSTQVLAEFYSAATGKLRMNGHDAQYVLERLRDWTLHRPDHGSIMRSLQLHLRYKIQWWDAMIVNSAIELGCSILWTEDLRHGQKIGGVTVRNPFR